MITRTSAELGRKVGMGRVERLRITRPKNTISNSPR